MWKEYRLHIFPKKRIVMTVRRQYYAMIEIHLQPIEKWIMENDFKELVLHGKTEFSTMNAFSMTVFIFMSIVFHCYCDQKNIS